MKEAFDKGKRERYNTKLTAKGEIQDDLTTEFLNMDQINTTKSSDDLGDVESKDQVQYHWDRLDAYRAEGRKRGYRFAGSES